MEYTTAKNTTFKTLINTKTNYFLFMYPYHNAIKQRISNGELTGFEFVDEYNKIKPCLLLYFRTYPYAKPIRKHRFEEYKQLLNIEL